MADPSRPERPEVALRGGVLSPGENPWDTEPPGRVSPTVLLTIVLVIATTGLVYELVIAAVASYVLGDSVRQFSLVIGAYLSALGLGAYLSKFVQRHLATAFVDVELAAALIGGSSAPLLFAAFGFTDSFRVALFAIVVITGTLVGLELPLLIRILQGRLHLRELIARALSFDYAGALIGSLAFSFVLVPYAGLSRASVLCGLLNAAVGVASTWLLPIAEGEQRRLLGGRVRGIAVVAILLVLLFSADRLTTFAEAQTYPGRVVYAERSAYQRIVVTDVGDGFELYLDGHLQLASRDEHRYHEALVHPALGATPDHRRVLIGGGGDGLAAREVLKSPRVETLTLVDIDPAVTRLARTYGPLADLGHHALADPRVNVRNEDAMRFLRESRDTYDVVILDFPDPTNYSIAKLYSAEFYRLVAARLAAGGTLAVQASSPLFGRQSFWCVVTTLEHAGYSVRPYHAFVPSFGDWGFALAARRPLDTPRTLSVGNLHFLNDALLPHLFAFPGDTDRVAALPNRLDAPRIVDYYLDEWTL